MRDDKRLDVKLIAFLNEMNQWGYSLLETQESPP